MSKGQIKLFCLEVSKAEFLFLMTFLVSKKSSVELFRYNWSQYDKNISDIYILSKLSTGSG